jgi:hypothetical protein
METSKRLDLIRQWLRLAVKHGDPHNDARMMVELEDQMEAAHVTQREIDAVAVMEFVSVYSGRPN